MLCPIKLFNTPRSNHFSSFDVPERTCQTCQKIIIKKALSLVIQQTKNPALVLNYSPPNKPKKGKKKKKKKKKKNDDDPIGSGRNAFSWRKRRKMKNVVDGE